jgi:Spy/CpxP family protein refolding chaperone
MLRQIRWVGVLAVVLAASPVFAQRGGDFGGGRGMGFGGFGGGRAGGSPLLLLGSSAVQEELALTADQKSQVESLVNQMREAMRPPEGSDFQSLRELPDDQRRAKFEELGKQREQQMAKVNTDFKPKFAEILDDVQLRRLQQISWQSQGIAALRDSEMASALGLSQDQQDKISAIQRDYQEKLTGGRGTRGPAGDRGRGEGGDRGTGSPEANRAPGGGRGNFEQFREAMTKRDADVIAVLTEEQQAKYKQLKGPEFDLSKLRSGRTRGFGRPGGRDGNRPDSN